MSLWWALIRIIWPHLIESQLLTTQAPPPPPTFSYRRWPGLFISFDPDNIGNIDCTIKHALNCLMLYIASLHVYGMTILC